MRPWLDGAPRATRTGGPRAGDAGDVGDGYVVLECFPTSIWRASGLTPLPAKAKRPDVQAHYDALAAAYALPPAQVTSHDDLQAIVAALAGVGAVGGPVQALPRGEAAGWPSTRMACAGWRDSSGTPRRSIQDRATRQTQLR